MTRRTTRPVPVFGYALALALGSVLLTAGLAITILMNNPVPLRLPLTTFDIAKALRSPPPAENSGNLTLNRLKRPPPAPRTRTDMLLGIGVARHLDVPASSVRFRIEEMPQQMGDRVEREYAAHGGEDRFNPLVNGLFKVAVLEPDGSWLVLTRGGRNPYQSWRFRLFYWILGGLALVIPLAWWFSRRLSRPIRSFAASAERLGRGIDVDPVPVYGPSEIRLAAAALNDMQARLQRYVRERTSVVGAIAHDLRTPLSRLNFHLAAAPKHIRESAEAEIREMEKMISLTLAFVQSETVVQDLEPVDIGLLVEGVADDFVDTGMPVELVETATATVSGDQILLKRLFANLIDNAIKYGGGARVSSRVEDGSFIVVIEDDGPGMTPADLARAFEPFYRGEPSRSRSTGGVGLGLAIVKSTTASHQGSVTLSNRAGGGFCAMVSLPLLPGTSPVKTAVTPSSAPIVEEV